MSYLDSLTVEDQLVHAFCEQVRLNTGPDRTIGGVDDCVSRCLNSHGPSVLIVRSKIE